MATASNTAPVLDFRGSPGPTVGAELELWLLDPVTLDITPAAARVLDHFGPDAPYKPELFQGIVEVNTRPCNTIAELRADLAARVAGLVEYGEQAGFTVCSSGTHPFARYRAQPITERDRYQNLLSRLRWPLRRMMICGLHVHVGVGSGEKAIAVMNSLAAFMPYVIALSGSSPYWNGEDTGLASARLKIFELLPTAGIPPALTNWSEFTRLMHTLINAGSIQTVREVWWDVRPHLSFGTIEVRVADAPPTIEESARIAALCQSLVAYLSDLYDRGQAMPFLKEWTMRENKWRAARWGHEALMIRNEHGDQTPIPDILREWIEILLPTADKLGCASELAAIIDSPLNPSAARQRATFARTGSLYDVTDELVNELKSGL
jgi:glutamate---cysteine ligase / carboxylate-amine ligase